MMRNHWRELVLFGCMLPLSAAPMYTMVDLGTLGGTSSTAYGISNSGVIAGSATNAGESQRAFEWSASAMQELNAPNAPVATARGVNTAGSSVGVWYSSAGAAGVIWNASGAHTLGTLGGAESYALAINDAGTVAGAATTNAASLHAFTWTNGVMLDLGTLPGGVWSSANAISNSGAVAGTSMNAAWRFRATLWSGSAVYDLGTLGGSNSYAFAINDAGQIAGAAQVSTANLHAFLYTMTGGMTDLGTLGGANSSAYGMNSRGDIVGYSNLAASGTAHATLWRDGILYDLNAIAAGIPGFELNTAYAINDAGQIVGEGTYLGQQRAFLLNPVSATDRLAGPLLVDAPVALIPEPAFGVITGAGAILIMLARKRLRSPCAAHPPTPETRDTDGSDTREILLRT